MTRSRVVLVAAILTGAAALWLIGQLVGAAIGTQPYPALRGGTIAPPVEYVP